MNEAAMTNHFGWNRGSLGDPKAAGSSTQDGSRSHETTANNNNTQGKHSGSVWKSRDCGRVDGRCSLLRHPRPPGRLKSGDGGRVDGRCSLLRHLRPPGRLKSGDGGRVDGRCNLLRRLRPPGRLKSGDGGWVDGRCSLLRYPRPPGRLPLGASGLPQLAQLTNPAPSLFVWPNYLQWPRRRSRT